jgi:hypothetical protein
MLRIRTSSGKEITVDPTLNGKWAYRSFHADPIVVKNGKVDGNPNLAIPWAPLGELDGETDAAGIVKGKLTFAPGVALAITGRITPAAEPLPASLEVTAEGLSAVYRIKGFFTPHGDHVVGTVLSVANDLAKQPNGTLGAIMLYQIKSDP